MKYSVIYNPISGSGTGKNTAKKLVENLPNDQFEFFDIIETSKNYKQFFENLKDDTAVLLVGGDGTVNRFANDADGFYGNKDIYYFPSGSGNDFWKELGGGDKPILINKYLTDLPEVFVNGKTQKFINAVGYGIDGYCCEVGDLQRAKSNKPVNYTTIAIKGCLGGFTCPNAEITVDGVKKSYKKVWLAPTVKGRFYGGGMIPAPKQDRFNENRTLSSVVWHGSNRLKTLLVFPSIFKGEHVKHTEYIEIREGKEINVKFDKPTALQIDGETVLNVIEYTVKVK